MKPKLKKKNIEGTVLAFRLPSSRDAKVFDNRISLLVDNLRATQNPDEKLFTKGDVVTEIFEIGLKALEKKYSKAKGQDE